MKRTSVRSVCVLLALVMLVTAMPVAIAADSFVNSKSVNARRLESKYKDYNLQLLDIATHPELTTLYNEDKLIRLDSYDQLDMVIQALIANAPEVIELNAQNTHVLDRGSETPKNQSYSYGDQYYYGRQCAYSDYWASAPIIPMFGPIDMIVIRNVNFMADWVRRASGAIEYTNVYNIFSYATGILGLRQWIHRWGVANIMPPYGYGMNNSVYITVRGTVVVGVVIGNQPIGISFDQDWNFHLGVLWY